VIRSKKRGGSGRLEREFGEIYAASCHSKDVCS
jgi:hypothetical protein